MTHKALLRDCREAALKSPLRRKHGAILTDRKGRILSVGTNHMGTFLLEKEALRWLESRIYSVHAEVACILGARRKAVRGSTLYIYGETDKGTPTVSKPCPHCMSIARKAGVYRVIYSTPTGVVEEKL
jgi:deoxycytidylate deaminase